jgi:antitoxin (DNA-binding transcriptional repressor) of toxin-antitoxin stability system
MSVFSNKTNAKPTKTNTVFANERSNEAFFGVQAKLNIGKSNDKYEVEADKTADKVIENKQHNAPDPFFSPSPLLQKKLASEVQKQDDKDKEIQKKTIVETITPVVQLTPLKEEEVQQKTEKEGEQVQTKKELQQKSITENSPLVIQLAPIKEEIQKKTEEIQTKKELQQKSITENNIPVIQLTPIKEEEVQKKTEENIPEIETKKEIQQKAITENSTHSLQLSPIKEDEVQKKTEINKEQVQLKNETAIIEPQKTILKPIIQTKVEEEVQAKEEDEVQAKEEESELQMSASGDASPNNNNLESNLNSSKGGGSPLPQNTKTEMESGFGADFSNVRVHNDSNAVQMNKQLGSQAFAKGNDIYFNEGKFNPSSQSGKHLLAHELTHTVQQGASVRMKPEISATSETIQPSLLSSALSVLPDSILNSARHIPGYTLITVLAEYDPIFDRHVPRTPINLLEGLMGLVPFGTAIFDKLQEYGIIDQVFDWVNGRLSELNLTMQSIMDMVQQAWDESSTYDFVDKLIDKFSIVFNRVRSFASSLVDQIITWVKEALIGIGHSLKK